MTHWEKVGVESLQKVSDTLKRYVGKWVPILGLDSWELTVDYVLAPSNDCIVDQAGRACVRWKYKEAEVSFYLSSITEVDEARLEYIVVHELCHVLLNQMRGVMNWDHNDMANEERVVTETARSFIRANIGVAPQ